MSVTAINMFGIGDGGYVEFFHDEENNQWYIAKSSKPCGFRVAINACNFGCRDLVKRLAQDEKKHFLISTNTIEYGGYTCHPLIEVKK